MAPAKLSGPRTPASKNIASSSATNATKTILESSASLESSMTVRPPVVPKDRPVVAAEPQSPVALRILPAVEERAADRGALAAGLRAARERATTSTSIVTTAVGAQTLVTWTKPVKPGFASLALPILAATQQRARLAACVASTVNAHVQQANGSATGVARRTTSHAHGLRTMNWCPSAFRRTGNAARKALPANQTALAVRAAAASSVEGVPHDDHFSLQAGMGRIGSI